MKTKRKGKNVRNKSAGFTLLELLVIIAIIGLLTAMIFPTLGKVRIRARNAKVISELKTIELALMDYYTEYSGFPTNKDTVEGNPSVPGAFNGLQKLVEKEYLDTALLDAFGSDRVYTYYSSDDYDGTGAGEADLADSCIVFSIGPNYQDNGATDFGNALDDAYPDMNDLDQMPTSDNIYLFLNSNASRTDPLAGREGDIRYKK